MTRVSPSLWFASGLVLAAVIAATAQPERKDSMDARPIERLIAQLGSKDFAQREAASRSLERIGSPAFTALRRAAATSDDGEIRRRAKRLIEAIENGLDYLLTLYRSYGLPLPPADAKLVRYQSRRGGVVNRKRTPATHSLAFMLRSGTRKTPPIVLDWYEPCEVGPDCKPVVWEPQQASPAEVQSLLCSTDLRFPSGLLLAIQCKARGWNPFAEAVLAASLKPTEDTLPVARQLTVAAWWYWESQLHKPATDWTRIATRLKTLIEIEKTLDTKTHRRLLQSLDAALVPSKARPGSTAALIDGLIDRTSPVEGTDEEREDPRYGQLVEMGFSAVDDLLQHLEDDRLTRSLSLNRQNRVGEAVCALLQDLSDGELNLQVDQQREAYFIPKAEVLVWWDRVKKQGEEAYLLAHVLRPRAYTPVPFPLRIIMKKYPQHLPKLYHQVLEDRPRMQSESLAEAIRESSLPRSTKRDLLLYGASSKDMNHRLPALGQLHSIDSEEFAKRLIATLHALPQTPVDEYGGCPDLDLARLIRLTDDARAWKALLDAARRADVGFRMELLELGSYPAKPTVRRRQLAFLSAFLDDASLRDAQANRQRYQGSYPGSAFPRLEVRNFVARIMARNLQMPVDLPLGNGVEPFEDWTPAEWAKFRQEVREALRQTNP